MTNQSRPFLMLVGFWMFAIIATYTDHMVGTEPETYHLIGVAIAISIAFGVLKISDFRKDTDNC